MKKRILTAALTLALASALPAMFLNNSVQVPVDRVTANVEKWIKEKPDDAQGYYVLARIHAMAYAYGPNLTLSNPNGMGRGRAPKGDVPATAAEGVDPFAGQLPGFTPMDSVEVRRDEEKKILSADDAKHLEAAIANYTTAAKLDPKSGIYELGLAWILQETAKGAGSLPTDFSLTAAAKPTDAEKTSYDALIIKLGDNDAKAREDATKALAAAMPKPYAQLRALKTDDAEISARAATLLKTYWDLQALEHFRKAWAINLPTDLQSRGGLRRGDSNIAVEAGEEILQLLSAHPDAARENEAKDIAANIKTLNGKPFAMTPIIFSMPGVNAAKEAALGDLIDSSKRVHFDLAADGIARTWPWLRPTTALLVWDPAHAGKITDARQLFGSRTWYVCFRNGYEALSTLDDNRDGKLTGAELQGIAVWLDKNSNGISDPGEVLTLQQAGIQEIAAAPDSPEALSARRGIRFHDGSTTPTFDWITEPAPPDSK